MTSWYFLTNHSHVLGVIARDPTVRLRDIAQSVGITERAAQRIVTDLVDEGYVTRRRHGRRNEYELHLHRPLRHPLHHHVEVADVIRLVRRADR